MKPNMQAVELLVCTVIDCPWMRWWRKALSRAATFAVLAALSGGAVASPSSSLPSNPQENELRPTHPADARRAAENLARHALKIQDRETLIAAVSVLLQTGATLAEDDPWGVPALLRTIEGLSSGSPELQSAITRMRGNQKGACIGVWNGSILVPPGESQHQDYVLEANEVTDFSVSVMGNSRTADIDLTLFRMNGEVLGTEIGPESGTYGRAAILKYTPSTDMQARLEIQNRASVTTQLRIVVTKAKDGACWR